MVSFKGAHFVRDIILTCVRWYLAYPVDGNQLCETGHAPMLHPGSRQIAKHSPLTDP